MGNLFARASYNKMTESGLHYGTKLDMHIKAMADENFSTVYNSLNKSVYASKPSYYQAQNSSNFAKASINHANGFIKENDGSDGSIPDGMLGYEEWSDKQRFENTGLNPDDPEHNKIMQDVYGALDVDKNGTLDKKELIAGWFYRDVTDDYNLYGTDFESGKLEFDGVTAGDKTGKHGEKNLLSLTDDSGKRLIDDIYTTLFGEIPQTDIISDDDGSNDDIPTIDELPVIDEMPVGSDLSGLPEVLNEDPNGEIETSYQGYLGDCWLLAGINGLNCTDNGKAIIKDAIKENDDGSYDVNFKGFNLSYNITKDDLLLADDLIYLVNSKDDSGKPVQESAKYYSDGDHDVLLFELATERLLKDIRDGNVELPDDAPEMLYNGDIVPDDNGEYRNPLIGGKMGDVIYMLTGNNPEKFKSERGYEKAYRAIESNPSNSWATMCVGQDDDDTFVNDIEGNPVKISSKGYHAITIKGVENDNLTIINPWDSSEEIVVNKNEFKGYIDYLVYCTV